MAALRASEVVIAKHVGGAACHQGHVGSTPGQGLFSVHLGLFQRLDTMVAAAQHHSMTRTQVYLPAGQHRALRREARAAGVSMTEIVRRIVSEHLADRRGIESFPKETILQFVAIGQSGRADTSERHDQALDEAFRAGALR